MKASPMTPLQEQIDLAVKALEPFAQYARVAQDTMRLSGAKKISDTKSLAYIQNEFNQSADITWGDFRRTDEVLALLKAKATQPTGEVRGLIEEVIELRQWLDATRDERNFPAHLFGWCEEADSRLERLVDALERQSPTGKGRAWTVPELAMFVQAKSAYREQIARDAAGTETAVIGLSEWDCNEIAQAVLGSTPQPQQDAGSGGWKLVPVEPTDEMLAALLSNLGITGLTSYRALLAAAPQPEPPSISVTDVARALDVAVDYLTSAEKIEDEPSFEDGAAVLMTALRAAGYRLVPAPQPEPSEPEGFSAVGSRPEGRTPSRVSETDSDLEAELSEARHELSCCDDINLDRSLAEGIGELQADREFLRARCGRMETALKSIAANTCCGSCREAALVAEAALTREIP